LNAQAFSLSQAYHEEWFGTLVKAKTPNEIIIVTVGTVVEPGKGEGA
jgi:hypothetical protein